MGKWNGSYGIMLTPFKPDGRADLDEVERQVDILCTKNLAGIIVCGSTGEFLFMSEQQNKEVMRVAAKAAAGRKVLVGGATAPGRDGTLAYLNYMQTLGYGGALVAPPYYYIYPDEDIAQFYTEIAGADTGVPIVAYQIPAFTNTIGPKTFETLLSLPQVEALKNSGKDIQAIAQQVSKKNQVRGDFAILTGTEDAYLACLAAGCTGGFTAFGALMPNSMARIQTLFEKGDFAAAAQVQQSLLPMQALCASLPFPLGYKVLGELLGMHNGYYPQSISSGTRSQMQRVKQALQARLHTQEEHSEVRV